ncbi:uncharacterized protein LOC110271606 [Arachis ipaensis]|uniref:uncharacterized protein LOC110271606 n=1 Tax=Arachis ipaensis TaxID=130454 RepID=UPI000A2B7415|nr:uncharacterized protein LOC110271606 [Arachis ipaensis]
MDEAEERDPRGREDRARPAAAHNRRSCRRRHPRQIPVAEASGRASVAGQHRYRLEPPLKSVSVWMSDHIVTASFFVLRHHWSRPTGTEIAAALCSFLVSIYVSKNLCVSVMLCPSLHVAIEAVSAFGKASGAEASVAADFGLRETSSVDAFGLWFCVSR